MGFVWWGGGISRLHDRLFYFLVWFDRWILNLNLLLSELSVIVTLEVFPTPRNTIEACKYIYFYLAFGQLAARAPQFQLEIIGGCTISLSIYLKMNKKAINKSNFISNNIHDIFRLQKYTITAAVKRIGKCNKYFHHSNRIFISTLIIWMLRIHIQWNSTLLIIISRKIYWFAQKMCKGHFLVGGGGGEARSQMTMITICLETLSLVVQSLYLQLAVCFEWFVERNWRINIWKGDVLSELECYDFVWLIFHAPRLWGSVTWFFRKYKNSKQQWREHIYGRFSLIVSTTSEATSKAQNQNSSDTPFLRPNHARHSVSAAHFFLRLRSKETLSALNTLSLSRTLCAAAIS